MSVDVQDIIDAGYKLEFEYGEYDYSWDITFVFSKDGRVFNLSDSGCSCTSWGEGWDDVHQAIGDMYEVTKLPELISSDEGWLHGMPLEDIRGAYRKLGIH